MKTTSQPPSLIQQQAMTWVTRLHSTDCSLAERREFTSWLANDPLNLAAYRDAEQFWQQLQGLDRVAGPQLAAARQYMAQARLRRRQRWLSLGAVAMLIGVIVFNPNLWLKLTADVYQTAKGERHMVLLSDHSSVELNTDTELKVSYALGKRTVWLERGEAWFSVVHDEARPFAVIAADFRVQDIGTQFNVYRQADQVSVAVQEGEVSISVDTTPPLHLKAGEQSVSVVNGQLASASISDINALGAWRQGLLIFKQRSLKDVLSQLSRYHNVQLSIADPQLQTLSVSGRFPANDLTQTLTTIAAALSVAVVNDADGRIIIQKAR